VIYILFNIIYILTIQSYIFNHIHTYGIHWIEIHIEILRNIGELWISLNRSDNTLNICESGCISGHFRGRRKTPAMESKWLKHHLQWMNCFETWFRIILCKFGQKGPLIGGCIVLRSCKLQ
jgi:hypothetical protein